MEITAITQQKRNLENVNIFLNGKYWLSLSKSQMLDFKIYKGKSINNIEKKEIEDASGENKILEKVLRFLSIRPRSEYEVKNYLILKRELDEEYAKKIITKLKDKKFINDLDFTHWFIKNRIESAKYGENRIKSELIKKGVNNEIIKSSLRELLTKEIKETQKENMKNLISKFRTKIKFKDERDLKNKLVQRMVSRGFKYDDFKNFI